MWDLPRLGIEPVSPTLAGELFTTEPPGKPHPPSSYCIFMWLFSYLDWEMNLDEPDFYLPLCQWHQLIFLPQLASIHSTSSSEDTALPIIVFWIVSLTSSKATKAELINLYISPYPRGFSTGLTVAYGRWWGFVETWGLACLCICLFTHPTAISFFFFFHIPIFKFYFIIFLRPKTFCVGV